MVVSVVVRDDLAEAHRLAWEHIAAPGSWWSGAERVELAGTALLAIVDDDPLPPWVGVTSTGRIDHELVAPPRLTMSPTVSPVTPAR